MILSPHEVAWLVIQHWKDPDQQRIAVAVCLAESAGNTDAIGRSTEGDNIGQRDHGLWQISGRWHGEKLQLYSDWRDPMVNVELARQVWEERKRAGKRPWGAWAVFNSGAYEKFLPDADHALDAPFPPPPKPMSSRKAEELTTAVAVLAGQVSGSTDMIREVRGHFS